MSVASPPTLSASWPRLLVAAGVLATLAGFVIHGTWRALPAERFALSLVLALIASALAWPLQRWLRVSWATALVAVWLGALVVHAGPLQALAASVLGLGALSVGLCLTPDALPARAALAIIVGLMSIAGLAGWIIALPIHTVWLWAAVLLALIALQRHALLRTMHATMAGWTRAVATSPRAAMLCAMLLGLASTACWLPALQMDDLTYHLGLPTQLMQHARYSPMPAFQIWSYAPWAGDVLHGIASVLSRREAHGAVNALWLTSAAGAAWSIVSSLRASTSERWASLALFASLPPLVWIAAGMQTELAGTAVTLALVAILVADTPGRLWAGTALVAGLFALKPVHGVAALPLLVYAALAYWPQWTWRRLALALALFAVLALSSYTQSWLATGNPVLPIFNSVFQSPYFPSEQFVDPRWHAGFGADLLWRMTFDTDRYVEAWEGGYGFVLIVLSGLWLLQLLRPGRRALMLAVTATVFLPLMPMQYARYAFPGVAVLAVLLPLGSEAAIGRRALLWLVVGVCALNLAYQANASWLHHSAALKRTIRSPFDDTATLQAYLPERLLLRRLPEGDTGLVLATDPARGFIAELGGRGRTVSPHSPYLQKIFAHDVSAGSIGRLFFTQRIRWVLVNTDAADPALRAGLQEAKARMVAREGHMELWQVDPIIPATERTP